MEIKAEVWEKVMDFASRLAKEGRQDQYWTDYNALRDYCEAQSLGGYDHPFLWETLADFTMDDGASIPLYLKALSLANEADALPYRVSIRFALAERHKSRGDVDLAREYAIAADDEARQIDDLELRRRISQFLLARK
jgi:hypothetical protein